MQCLWDTVSVSMHLPGMFLSSNFFIDQWIRLFTMPPFMSDLHFKLRIICSVSSVATDYLNGV